jgi:EAL domain-containing protein (putative c-di-GMP-specific phosphodiesterase class I)/CheY-like chemotaxis protein
LVVQSRGRLLIFEDDPGVSNVIRIIATASGMEARVVVQSERFFAAVDSWRPTHIALDLVMPDMDGVQVLGELGRRKCSADIIITSGMGSRVLDAAGRSANERGLNVVGVLSKPFSAQELRALLAPARTRVPANRHSDAEAAVEYPVTVDAFRWALASHQFEVHYQPKIECLKGELAGFEALVRWAHPERGLIMPLQFIPFAEAQGLINDLTDAVLEQSLAWFGAARRDADLRPGVSLSVNLSALSLQDGTLVDRIAGYCERNGVPLQRLIFEVTETGAMRDPIAALDMLTRMRVKGFQLALDDFGTGYSSMLQLVRLPFSEIKVDKSFVMSAVGSAESSAVVKSIIDLGRSLGLKSAAEGVENAATLELLQDLGCDYAQGYGIGRPMGDRDIAAWMAARAPLPAT